jgi:hypothetical protein
MGKNIYRIFMLLISAYISISFGVTNCYGKVLYAIESCQTYNGPSKDSGLFFYSPSAKKALTLDEREQYEVIKEQGDWVQIDVFGKEPWVERQCMSSELKYKKNTLKKNALVCRTKEQFNEFVENRNNKAHTMNMLANGECLFNMTNAEVRVEILEGIFPKIKVKVYWGDEIFVGWTETTMVNE